MKMRWNLWAVVVALGAGLTAGCTSTSTAGAIDNERKMALEEIGQMLKSVADEGRKPPAKLADLGAVEPYLPTAGARIRSGEVVYVWGAGYVAGGTELVAWEKVVPESGGYVLQEDGTVKKMSAAEFQSAPKAK
jgi:hypothetical protein